MVSWQGLNTLFAGAHGAIHYKRVSAKHKQIICLKVVGLTRAHWQ